MAEVIQIGQKLKHTREKEAEIIKKRKILAVRKVFQCTQCAFKCEKCGTQINPIDKDDTNDIGKSMVPFRFCESCAEEYSDYKRRLDGEKDPDCYWHNDVWADVWEKWIDYQKVIRRYLKSKEFLQLIKELQESNT